MAGAEPVDLLFRVDIEMTGIPDHAWHRSTAELLLAPFCEIEHLAPETRDGSDRSALKLSAWTNNPDAIPRHSELFLPDADAVLPDANPAVAERLSLRVYRRPVTIFVTETADYRRPAPLPQAGRGGDDDGPPGDDDGTTDDGPGSPPLPDPWPRRHEFPRRSGNNDAAAERFASGGAAGKRRRRRLYGAPPPARI